MDAELNVASERVSKYAAAHDMAGTIQFGSNGVLNDVWRLALAYPDHIAELSRLCELLEANTTDFVRASKKYEAENAQLREQLAQLKDYRCASDDTAQILRTERDQLRQRLAAAGKTIGELSVRNAQFKEQINASESEIGAVAARLRTKLDAKEAENAALRERLEAAEKLLSSIVVTDGVDQGVVLLSYDGPSHYDAEVGCQVYDCENFSPLGDALIALHECLKLK